MFICPNCASPLIPRRTAQGVYWGCDSCRGRAVAMGLLRKTVDDRIVAEAWFRASQDQRPSGRRCPICAKEMLLANVRAGDEEITLDLCRRCEFIWFDPDEYEAVPPLAPKPRVLGEVDPASLTPEQREKIAMAKLKYIEGLANAMDPTPDVEWKSLPAILGLPVEMQSSALKTFPWATWILSGLITAVSVAAFFNEDKIVKQYGLIPADAWRMDGLTFLTSFFIHGGIIHLLGNMYFLLTFGRAVENFIGTGRWLILVFLAALGGDFLHVALDPNAGVPLIGASGGISGLIVFYALKFPHAKIGLLLRYFYRWIELPAWFALVLWVLLQVWGVVDQIRGYGNVSALAHFGGVAVGLGCWSLWRNVDAKPVHGNGLVKVIG